MRRKTIRDAASSSDKAISKKQSQRDVRWDKLDNTAHLFPVIAGERMSNVYRLSVNLTELIQPELLQEALNIVLPKFDGFNLRLRSGIFWQYFEENNKPAPIVKEEQNYPCRFIRTNKNRRYMFRVTYYKYRINLEVFHVLTDGMGGFNFLKELTYQYLRLAHPELGEQFGDTLSSGTTLNREDSFLRHYKKDAPKTYKTQRAFLLKGDYLRKGEFGVMHGYLKVPELKSVCKSYGVTINEYLVATYIWSIYMEGLHGCPSKDPIRIAVPVNLRPFFKSITTKNFFVMISAEFHPTKDEYTFQEVLEITRDSLRSQLNAQHLEQIFSYNVSNQKNKFLQLFPLPLKHIGMRFVYTQAALANTTTLSNLGQISVNEHYQPYIEQFHVIMAISKGQPIKGTICSYGDTLVFTFSYDLQEPAVQRGFFTKLAQDGLHVEIESNGVHYE